MTCERTRALLSLYVLGDLKPDAAAAAAAHMAACEDCRQQYDQIRATVAMLRDALAETREAAPRLSADRRRRILQGAAVATPAAAGAPTRRRPAARHDAWVFRHHRGLAMAAGIVAVLGLLWSVTLPNFGRHKCARIMATRIPAGDALKMEEISDRRWVGGVAVHDTHAEVAQDDNGVAAQVVNGDFALDKVMLDPALAAPAKPAATVATLPEPSAPVATSEPSEPSAPFAPPAPPAPSTPVARPEPPDPSDTSFSPAPAMFDSVAIVKSPIIMRGVYGARAPDVGQGVGERGRVGGWDERHARGDVAGIEAEGNRKAKASPVPGPVSGTAAFYRDLPTPKENLPATGLDFAVPGGGKKRDEIAVTVTESTSGEADRMEVVADRMEVVADRLKVVHERPAEAAKDAEIASRWREERREEGGRRSGSELKQEPGVNRKQEPDVTDEDKKEAGGDDKSVEAVLDRPRLRAYGVNPFIPTAVDALSTFAIDVDTASYTMARGYMQRGVLPPAELVRTEEFVNAFDYGYRPAERETFRVYAEMAPSPFGQGLHLLKIGVKGRRLGREEERPAVLTLVIDTSGSMNQADRLGLVQASVRLLVERLGPHDRVAIVPYDSHARIALEHTSADRKAEIVGVVDSLQCRGSTNLEEAMHQAYALAVRAFVPGAENRVILMSDGVATMGADSSEAILKKVEANRRQGILCSVMGFGIGSYDDVMLESLANRGDGTYTFIDSIDQARRVLVDDLAATLNTIARDVKIQVQFHPETVVQHRQLGYENRQLAHRDFRNDAVDAGEIGSGQSVTALYECELQPRAAARGAESAEWRRDAPVATVYVRYRRVDTGAVEEIRHVLPLHAVREGFRDMPAEFRLAAAVAECAELLRGSPFAIGGDFEAVAALLRPVALELHLDTRVQELLRLVHGAGSLGR